MDVEIEKPHVTTAASASPVRSRDSDRGALHFVHLDLTSSPGITAK